MVYTVNDKVSCNFISNTNFTANSYSEENVNNRLLLSNNIMMRWRKSKIITVEKIVRRILMKRRKIIRIVLCVWVPQLAMLTLPKKRHMRMEVRSSKMQNATTTYAATLAEI